MIFILLAIGAIIVMACMGNEDAPEHTYNASFGDEGKYVSRWNHGFATTGNKALTKEMSHTNCAVFGPTGSGKSSTVIFGSAVSLARGGSSIVFNDVSGELWDKLSNYLFKKGYRVIKIDWSNPEFSEKFNPIAFCRTVSDIQKLSLIIIRNSIGESKSDPFWENSSIMILGMMIRYLVFYAEPEQRTMQNVLRLVEKLAVDGNAISKLFIKTDEELLNSYKATLVMGEKTLQSVIATLRTALNLWIDPAVCATTACNTVDLECLRKDSVAIFLSTPLKDLEYYKPISALLIQTLFNHVLSRIPNKGERSVFFILDEFGTYRFPNIVKTVNNIRKTLGGILLCVQDEQALISKYGPAEAHELKTSCGCQVYLKGQPLSTCKELSQILGKYTYVKENTAAEKVRELMTPDEIRMSEDAIILINNQQPLRCNMVPYFKNMFLQHLTNATPYPLEKKEVTKAPLIQFS